MNRRGAEDALERREKSAIASLLPLGKSLSLEPLHSKDGESVRSIFQLPLFHYRVAH
jgi:hypothetical protein